MFFNSHIKKGREIGAAVRGMLSTACIGTGFFDPVAPKPLPETFFDDYYIRAFTIVSCSLLMKYQMGGANWSQEKSGRCIGEALHVIDPTGHLWRLHLATTVELVEQPDFINGREAAATLYGVIHDVLRPDDPDPVLAEAKKLVEASDGMIDLAFATTQLTIIDYIKKKYDEAEDAEDDFISPWGLPEAIPSDKAAKRTSFEPKLSHSDTKICPFCAEEIRAKAKKCKHCGEWLVKV